MRTNTRRMAGYRTAEIICCPGHEKWYRYPPTVLRRRTRHQEAAETRRLAHDANADRQA